MAGSPWDRNIALTGAGDNGPERLPVHHYLLRENLQGLSRCRHHHFFSEKRNKPGHWTFPANEVLHLYVCQDAKSRGSDERRFKDRLHSGDEA